MRRTQTGDGTMTTFTIQKGTRQVMVIKQGDRYSARLFVNDGETATTTAWKGKTEAGVRKWAAKVMA